MEQYIYNKIVNDETLAGLLDLGEENIAVYPTVVPRGVEFDQAMTFTTIFTNDAFPNITSVNIQFNIFAKTHAKVGEISRGLKALFHQIENDSVEEVDDVNIVFATRFSESDLGFNFDDKLYQRESTYLFKLR